MTLFLLAACGPTMPTTHIPGDTAESTGSYTTEEVQWTDDGSGGSSDDDNDDTDSGADSGTDDEDTVTWYYDGDNDGWGLASVSVLSVDEPTSGNWTILAGDCNDASTTIYPGATETVGDGVDQNCDGVDTASTGTWYYDGDGDGYGSTTAVTASTDPGALWVATNGDCDDSSASVYPGASEGTTADGIDQDCDGTKDEGTTASSHENGDAITVTVRIVDVADDTTEWDLRVLDMDGSSTYWFGGSGGVFLDESDADDSRTFATACGNDLKFNGTADDTEFWGDYISGACQGDETNWVTVESDESTCSAVAIEVIVGSYTDDVTLFSGDDMFYEVNCR